MKYYLERENSIWNNMLHQTPRRPEAEKAPKGAVPAPCGGVRDRARRALNWMLVALAAWFVWRHAAALVAPHAGCPRLRAVTPSGALIDAFDGVPAAAAGAGGAAPRRAFEVTYPFAASPKFGRAVHTLLVLNHTFGNSWGQPAVANFTPPDVAFDKVVLTLNVSVGGVQYDRLANVFLNGVQVWRTLTAEPGNTTVESTASKDVTAYAALFGGPVEVMLQLDNLLTPRLTGAFRVELAATFYRAERRDKLLNATDALWLRRGPALRVHALAPRGHTAPVAYLPLDKLAVSLPRVPANTTRLTLLVFALGNAAEEFWYTNVLDKFVHQFEGRTLLGHGPVRVVNVLFNGDKVATQQPQPFVFTGGILPALWLPVVATLAFDLGAIDVDLTALLPLLWEHQAVEDRILEIEVTNGYDELKAALPAKSGIAENWIALASLLAFEDERVVRSSGEVVRVNDTKKIDTVAFAVPWSGSIQQIIGGTFELVVAAVLNFSLADGSSVNASVQLVTTLQFTNIQRYTKFGAQQLVVHVGQSKRSTTVVDLDATRQIQQVNLSLTYPMVVHLAEKNHTTVPDDVNIVYDVLVALARLVKVAINGFKAIKEKVAQNGTSTYHITSGGNHGVGALDTKLRLDMGAPLYELHYARKVSAANGTVTLDEESDSLKPEVAAPAAAGAPCHDALAAFETRHHVDLSQLRQLDEASAALLRDVLAPEPCHHGKNRYPPRPQKFRKHF